MPIEPAHSLNLIWNNYEMHGVFLLTVVNMLSSAYNTKLYEEFCLS